MPRTPKPTRSPRSSTSRPHGRTEADRSPAPRSPAPKPLAPKPQAPRPHGRTEADRPPVKSNSGSKNNGIWLFGLHAVAAALDNPLRKVQRLVTTSEGLAALTAMVGELPPSQTMERADLTRLLPSGAVHQGVAMLTSALPVPGLDDCLESLAGQDNVLLLVLDQVTDPHNVGAIIRSAAAFGAKAVLTQDRHSPEETGTLAKSASGALERLPLIRVVNIVHALDALKREGFWIAGLAGEAERSLAEANLSGRIALVLGAEGPGLRRLTREHCDLLVRLPITDAVESLNVSNAAAVALYEIVRQ